MRQRLTIFAVLMALALAACGGGGDSRTEDDARADAAAEEQGKALEVFESRIAAATNAPVEAAVSVATCDASSGACAALPADGIVMNGIDMIAAATDPDATLPDGRAWLVQEAQGAPLPVPSEGLNMPDAAAILSYNPAIDGETPPTMRGARADAGAVGNDVTTQAVTSGAQIVNPMSGTNSRRVKLIMTFRKKGESTIRKQVCSGTLIDSKWVLTAAHCLWRPDAQNGGYMDVVYAAPAYENGQQPWGRAYATQMLVPAAYRQVDPPRWSDVAWFKLDRAVGGMVGFDYATHMAFPSSASTDALRCSEATSSNFIFTTQAYTADGSIYPGQSVPSDGSKMWQTSFRFDYCYDASRLVGADYPHGAGASGSAAFQSVAGYSSKRVKAVLARGNSTYTEYVSLTPQHADAIAKSIYFVLGYSQGLAGPESELTPAWVRVVTSTKDSEPAGENSPVTSFTVGEDAYLVFWYHNSAFFAEHETGLSYSLYLSSDSWIDTKDQKIGSFYVPFAKLGAKQTGVTTPKIKIPCPKAGAPSAEYFIGVMIHSADADQSNNRSQGLGGTAKVKLDKVCPA